jgi:hypothetical protein
MPKAAPSTRRTNQSCAPQLIGTAAGQSIAKDRLGLVWHDAAMLRVAEILIRLVCETLRWLRLAVRSWRRGLG